MKDSKENQIPYKPIDKERFEIIDGPNREEEESKEKDQEVKKSGCFKYFNMVAFIFFSFWGWLLVELGQEKKSAILSTIGILFTIYSIYWAIEKIDRIY